MSRNLSGYKAAQRAYDRATPSDNEVLCLRCREPLDAEKGEDDAHDPCRECKNEVECSECGDWFDRAELVNGVCEECGGSDE